MTQDNSSAQLVERLRLDDPNDYRGRYEEMLTWTSSAFLAGESVKDEDTCKAQLYSFLCSTLGYLLAAEVTARNGHDAADLIEHLARPQPSTSSVEAVSEIIHDFLDERFPDGALPGGVQLFADDHLDADFKHEAGCDALAERILAALPAPEREPMREEWQPLRDLVDAARGLSHGVDWNNGTNAKLHGYRRKLLDALPGAEAALAALAPPPAQSGDRT